jgi:hypothetical protein
VRRGAIYRSRGGAGATLADKGYDGDAIRQHLRNRGANPTEPHGAAPSDDETAHLGMRRPNVASRPGRGPWLLPPNGKYLTGTRLSRKSQYSGWRC